MRLKTHGADLDFGLELPMSDRGLLAPLSPHEEVTLRRMALGIANPTDLPARDVERLKILVADLWISAPACGLPLKARSAIILAFPQIAPPSTSGAPDKGLAKMAEFISKAAKS